MSTEKVDRREQILEISQQLFASLGYHKTKISDIVREAGIAQGTFYWHFKSKEAIALEIIQQGRNGLLEVVAHGHRKFPGTVKDVVNSSEKLFEELFDFSASNRYMMEMIFKGIDGEESLKQVIIETRLKVEEAFQNNIKRAMELNILPERDPGLQAALLMSLFEGILSRWLFGPVSEGSHIRNKTTAELAKEMVRFEFFGLLGT
ncbi:TetR family transcriptional regulator [Bacillus sp. Leaf13]|nr:TetR family transcriptional regulator [Bacillus sp. Leaf13]KRF67438.1 TetR family transcriptional regulator [Bacillus sp. Soil768D1]